MLSENYIAYVRVSQYLISADNFMFSRHNYQETFYYAWEGRWRVRVNMKLMFCPTEPISDYNIP